MTLWLLGIVAVLAVSGVALVILNGRKLISDWPRPRPVHNVDAAWIKVYLGLGLICAAWFIARDPLQKLREPTPLPVAAPEEGAEAPKG